MEGRSGALERLSRELAAATDGKRLALVGGEPGIGKTRLVSEFAARAHGGGCTVLYGRSSDGPDPPYGPFAEALGQYLRHAPEALEGEGAAELARLVPETRKSTGGPGPEPAPPPAAGPEQFVLFGAVASLLERASAGSTLLFVLEDLHWADEGTMLLLRHLLTGAASTTSALFLGTYRPTDVEPDSPSAHSLAALIREETSRIDLEPLSRDEAFELLERLAGHGLGGSEAELANALHAESAGNPLFLTELVRTLLESGSIRQDDGGWRVDAPGDTPLPTTLAEVIRQRVAELGSEAADALGAASVSGLEFDPELVERAIGRQPGELGSAWDAAERAALVMETESGQLAFNHPLVERTLYKGLGSRRRGALHRRIAEELEASDGRGQETELARHWSKAVPADPKMAELWAARAGDRALEHSTATPPGTGGRWSWEAAGATAGSGGAASCCSGSARPSA